MAVTWTDSVVDEQYDGAWNKVAYLHSLMRHELRQRERIRSTSHEAGHEQPGWTPSQAGHEAGHEQPGWTPSQAGHEAGHEHKRIEWMLWCDWDLIFTDLAAQLPLEE